MILHVASLLSSYSMLLVIASWELKMHLHQNRPIKRAGEAGIALRARRDDSIYFARLCASW